MANGLASNAELDDNVNCDATVVLLKKGNSNHLLFFHALYITEINRLAPILFFVYFTSKRNINCNHIKLYNIIFNLLLFKANSPTICVHNALFC